MQVFQCILSLIWGALYPFKASLCGGMVTVASPQSSVGSQQSAVGSRQSLQSAVSSQQSAVSSQQSVVQSFSASRRQIPACAGMTFPGLRRDDDHRGSLIKAARHSVKIYNVCRAAFILCKMHRHPDECRDLLAISSAVIKIFSTISLYHLITFPITPLTINFPNT